MSEERRATMVIGLELLHDMLHLPEAVQIEAVHVSADNFERQEVSLRLGGGGLPTEPAGSGMRLPGVLAEYRTTPNGPEFVRFIAIGPPVPMNAIELDDVRWNEYGGKKR